MYALLCSLRKIQIHIQQGVWWCGMEWDEMEWDDMEWDEMEWDEMGWDGMQRQRLVSS